MSTKCPPTTKGDILRTSSVQFNKRIGLQVYWVCGILLQLITSEIVGPSYYQFAFRFARTVIGSLDCKTAWYAVFNGHEDQISCHFTKSCMNKSYSQTDSKYQGGFWYVFKFLKILFPWQEFSNSSSEFTKFVTGKSDLNHLRSLNVDFSVFCGWLLLDMSDACSKFVVI